MVEYPAPVWWWWIASRAEDEQYKGKNNLLRRGALVLGELVEVKMDLGFLSGLSLVGSLLPISPFLWWWLVLFIEALVLFPNIRWEGIPRRPDLKGDS